MIHVDILPLPHYPKLRKEPNKETQNGFDPSSKEQRSRQKTEETYSSLENRKDNRQVGLTESTKRLGAPTAYTHKLLTIHSILVSSKLTMLQTSLGLVARSVTPSLRIFAAPLRRLADPGIGGGAMGHTWKDKETAAEATVCLF